MSAEAGRRPGDVSAATSARPGDERASDGNVAAAIAMTSVSRLASRRERYSFSVVDVASRIAAVERGSRDANEDDDALCEWLAWRVSEDGWETWPHCADEVAHRVAFDAAVRVMAREAVSAYRRGRARVAR